MYHNCVKLISFIGVDYYGVLRFPVDILFSFNIKIIYTLAEGKENIAHHFLLLPLL